MFYGPEGTGKSLVVNSLATECNCLVFDLSYNNIHDQCLTSQEYRKIMGATVVLARKMQPSIVMIDEAEKFLTPRKKIYLTGISKRYRKMIHDIRKNDYWDEKDRITVIASTNKPNQCSTKLVKSIFDETLYFPFPDYPTRSLLVQHFFRAKVGTKCQQFPLGLIAQISEGYTAGGVRVV